MIDASSIEDFDDTDGESVHAFGCDADTGTWQWAWVPLEYVYEAGRTDIIDGLGLCGGYEMAA
jgi:hypothetical protein